MLLNYLFLLHPSVSAIAATNQPTPVSVPIEVATPTLLAVVSVSPPAVLVPISVTTPTITVAITIVPASIEIPVVVDVPTVVATLVVRLSWTCDTQVVEDIASFRIFYGTTSHANVLLPESASTAAPYDTVVVVTDETARSYDLSLVPGVYCFRMTAIDSLGEESIFSDEVVWSSGLTPPTTVSAVTL